MRLNWTSTTTTGRSLNSTSSFAELRAHIAHNVARKEARVSLASVKEKASIAHYLLFTNDTNRLQPALSDVLDLSDFGVCGSREVHTKCMFRRHYQTGCGIKTLHHESLTTTGKLSVAYT